MKKVILIFCFYLCCKSINAQAFKVGDINCNYNVINHTFTTNCPGIYTASTETYTIDLNGDLISDINAESSCSNSPANSIWTYVSVSSSNGYEFIREASSGPFTPVKNLSIGTPLTPSFTWVPAGELYIYRMVASTPLANGQQTNPFYVGFRKILANDTIYGWIQMSSVFPGAVYSYAYGCASDTSSAPPPVITNTNTSMCLGDSITLIGNPSGGYFYGPGVVGNKFYSSIVSGPGTYKVVYNLNPTPSTVLCNGSSSISLTVNAPNTMFTGLPFNVCDNSTFTLSGSPLGGIFSGPGVSGNVFNSAITGAGTFSLSYTCTDVNGCSKAVYSSIDVIPGNTISATSNYSITCPGDNVIVSLNGGPATYSVYSNIGGLLFAIPGPTTIVVNPTVSVNYTVNTVCASPFYFTQNVVSCVGINELLLEQNSFLIFPNPNNGEFEIKGDKESTIFITNEFGQQIKTVELNSQNNFSSKITDLQNGVYFVGNKFSRQKVVVIK